MKIYKRDTEDDEKTSCKSNSSYPSCVRKRRTLKSHEDVNKERLFFLRTYSKKLYENLRSLNNKNPNDVESNNSLATKSCSCNKMMHDASKEKLTNDKDIDCENTSSTSCVSCDSSSTTTDSEKSCHCNHLKNQTEDKYDFSSSTHQRKI